MNNIRLVEILKMAMVSYREDAERDNGFLCISLLYLRDEKRITPEEHDEVAWIISLKIDNQPTLLHYLINHELPHESADKVAFYERWIKELESC